MKLTVMTSREKKSGRPTAFAAPIRVRCASIRIAIVLLAKMLQRFVTVFDHDNGRIDHAPIAIAIPPKDMIFEVCPSKNKERTIK
jgi:hypothetical protein